MWEKGQPYKWCEPLQSSTHLCREHRTFWIPRLETANRGRKFNKPSHVSWEENIKLFKKFIQRVNRFFLEWKKYISAKNSMQLQMRISLLRDSISEKGLSEKTKNKSIERKSNQNSVNYCSQQPIRGGDNIWNFKKRTK